MLVWGTGEVWLESAGHEYVCSTRVSDVLGMSVVRWIRGMSVVCWIRGLGLVFTNPVKTWGVLDVCVFGLRWCGWEVGLCHVCDLRVWVLCVDGKSRYLRILGVTSAQSCCTLSISAICILHCMFMTDIANPDLFVYCCRT